MNHRLLVATCLIVCGVWIVSLQPSVVSAQESTSATSVNTATSSASPATGALNLTVSPVTINLETKPGETVKTTLRVRNNGTQTERLVTSLGSFVADETGEQPQLIEPDPNEEFLQWLTLSETSFDVPTNEWKNIEVTFSPPSTAALSYYYTIYLQRAASVTAGPGEAKIEGSPAILVLTTVTSPQAKRELQLIKVTPKHSFVEFLPQEFYLDIQNTGNVHSMPQGTIFIDGQGQKDLTVLPINPGNNSILPQSTRRFTVKWSEGFPVRGSDAPYKLEWDFNQMNKFRIGKYTAHVVMVYDNGERDVPIESYVTFWVIPWKLIVIAIAIPVLPAALVFFFMKWRYGKKRV